MIILKDRTIFLIKQSIFEQPMPQITQRILSEEVLDKTMNLFWEKGFFNTSIEDIIETTGFNRAAIYKYFGGKDGLFVAMLKRYRSQVTTFLTAPLQNQSRGVEGIKEFFTQFIQLHEMNSLSRGCFLITTASEIPSHNEDVALLIKDFLDYLRKLFRNLLKSEPIQIKRQTKMDVDSTADFLVGNVFGLMTLCRSQAPKQVFENHICGIMDFLMNLSTKRSSKSKRKTST
jgi:TetR/AcrR family transcriptional repressor of nem operon